MLRTLSRRASSESDWISISDLMAGLMMIFLFIAIRGSDSNGAKSHVKGRSWDRLASQDLSPSVSQGTIWRYVAVDRRLGYA